MSIPRPNRRRALLILKAVVTLALLGWLAHRMLERDGVELLTARLAQLSAPWVALAVGVHFAAVTAGVLRWRLLLRAAGTELPLGWLMRSFLVGRFVGAFTPSTTGLDGWRIVDAGRASGSMPRSATAIGVEKLVGLVGMALVSAALIPFGGLALMGPAALFAAAALGLGAALGLVVLASPRLRCALAARVPRRLAKVSAALEACALSPAQIARAVGLGVLSHLALSAVFVPTAYAIGLEVDVATLLVTGNAIVLAVLLPVSIGGVGVREGVAVVLLGAAGVASTDAVLVGLLGYLTGQVPALLGGVAMGLGRVRADVRVAPRATAPTA